MAAVTARRLGEPDFIEGRHLDQLGQLDALHQQLRDTVAAVHDNRVVRIKIDQRDLDLTTVASVDGTGSVDDRKPYPRSQTGSRMHQPHGARRDRNSYTGAHQRPPCGGQFDILGAEQIDSGIIVVAALRQRQVRIEADHRQTGQHDLTDYS